MAQGDLFTNLMEGSGIWEEALRKNVISMERLKEIQEEIAEQQMDIYGTRRDMLKSDYKGVNIMKRMVSSGAKIMAQTEKIKNAKKNINSTEKDLVKIQKKIHNAQKLGKDSEATSLKKQYNAIKIKNEKNKIGLKQMRQTVPVLGQLSAQGGAVGAIADGMIGTIGGITAIIPVIGAIISGLINIGKAIVGIILKPLKAAFGIFLEMQIAVGNLSADIGLTAIESRLLLNNMSELALSAMKFGGSMKDVVTVMQQFSDVTGKNRMFSEGQMEKIIELGLGTGLGVDAASEMAASFENMGISLEKTINLTDKARNLAARYNVNTTKVLKTYDGLVQSLTGIGFGKGLENLTKLAAKATAIRFDIVASTKAFADTFFDPEKAVEASARMQTLGGKFAASFGDPMQLAFESMNDPTALAEKFAATVSEIVKKDSKGNYFIPPEERKSLKIAAETLGQNYEDAVQTAVEQRKIADKMATLQKSGFSLIDIKEEDRPALANLMSLNDKGQYVIKNSAGVEELLANMTDKNGLKAILDSRKKNETAALGRKNMMERLEMIYDRFIMGFSDIFTKLFGSQDFDSFLVMVEKAGNSIAKFVTEDLMGGQGFAAVFKSILASGKLVFEQISSIFSEKEEESVFTKIGKSVALLFNEFVLPAIVKLFNYIRPLLEYTFGSKAKRKGLEMQQSAFASGGGEGGIIRDIFGEKGVQQKQEQAGKDYEKSKEIGGWERTFNLVSGIFKQPLNTLENVGTTIFGDRTLKEYSKVQGLINAEYMSDLSLGAMDKYTGYNQYDKNKSYKHYDEDTVDTGKYNDGEFMINSSGKAYYGQYDKGDMVQFIHEKSAKNAMSNIGDSDKSGNLNTTSFKTNIDQFINEKTIQEAITTMFKSMDSGVSSGTSSVVRHEGSIILQTPDGRFITHDQFNGASDMFGARLKGISQADSGGFGNYRSGTHDPIQPMYA